VSEVLRQIAAAFHAELRPKRKQPRSRSNPWPKCPDCYHRFPGLCAGCGLCPECGPRCTRCGECALICEGHEKEERDDYRG
jgi:hypothetical protein